MRVVSQEGEGLLRLRFERTQTWWRQMSCCTVAEQSVADAWSLSFPAVPEKNLAPLSGSSVHETSLSSSTRSGASQPATYTRRIALDGGFPQCDSEAIATLGASSHPKNRADFRCAQGAVIFGIITPYGKRLRRRKHQDA